MQIIIIVSIGRQVDAKAVQEQQEDKNNRCQNYKHLISYVLLYSSPKVLSISFVARDTGDNNNNQTVQCD